MLRTTLGGNSILFRDPGHLITFLCASQGMRDGNDQARRDFLAQRFLPQVQATAISRYPVQTILQITPPQRDVLYSSRRNMTNWEHLPPLVFAGAPELAPAGTVVEGENTVWTLDTTTDKALISSLQRYGALSVELVPEYVIHR